MNEPLSMKADQMPASSTELKPADKNGPLMMNDRLITETLSTYTRWQWAYGIF